MGKAAGGRSKRAGKPSLALTEAEFCLQLSAPRGVLTDLVPAGAAQQEGGEGEEAAEEEVEEEEAEEAQA